MEQIKAAVVGVGLFGEYHAKAYAEYHRSELAMVCDMNEQRAKAVAQKYGCDYTTKSEEIADRPDIEAVSIATPDFAHRDVALQLISAGKNVLVEKPLATSTAEAREMVKAAKMHGVKLMVDFQNRWNPPFVQAKQSIKAGELGDPVIVSGRLSNTLSVPTDMLSWSGKSGPQWFLFPHLIDIVAWLFEQKAIEVYALGRKGILTSRGIDTYDAIQALVSFESFFATVETAWVLPDSHPSLVDFGIVLLGTKGRMNIRADNQGVEFSGKKHQWPFVLSQQDAHGITSGFMQYPMMHFVDCVADDKTPLGTGEEGFHITAIIEAIEKSIAAGKPVKVEKYS